MATQAPADGTLVSDPGSTSSLFVRRCSVVLAILSVLFILQVGLAPYDFSGGPVPDSKRDFFSLWSSSNALLDVTSNIVFFAPLGFFVYMAVLYSAGNRRAAVSMTIVIAGLLSGLIEWLQAYSPTRISSLLDWAGNVIGAGMGTAIAVPGRWLLSRMSAAAIHELRFEPDAIALKAYCAILFLVAAIPFWISFDARTVFTRLSTGHWVPFSTDRSDALAASTAQAANEHTAYASFVRRRMDRWGRWFAECGSFAVLACVLQRHLRKRHGLAATAAVLLSLWVGIGLALALSLIQVPIAGRSIDSTDFLFRMVGLAVGLVLAIVGWKLGRGMPPPTANANPPRHRDFLQSSSSLPWRLGCLGTGLYILYSGLTPFLFDRNRNDAWGALLSSAMRPFASYAAAGFAPAIDDIMEKLAAYALLGGLTVASAKKLQIAGVLRRMTIASLTGIVLSVMIETAQIFQSTRVPSLTDPILALFGCIAGVLVWERGTALVLAAQSISEFGGVTMEDAHRTPAPKPDGPAGDQIPFTLPVPDEILSSLAEERSDAPSEARPQPKEPRIPK